jgi:hypothetical protein
VLSSCLLCIGCSLLTQCPLCCIKAFSRQRVCPRVCVLGGGGVEGVQSACSVYICFWWVRVCKCEPVAPWISCCASVDVPVIVLFMGHSPCCMPHSAYRYSLCVTSRLLLAPVSSGTLGTQGASRQPFGTIEMRNTGRFRSCQHHPLHSVDRVLSACQKVDFANSQHSCGWGPLETGLGPTTQG